MIIGREGKVSDEKTKAQLNFLVIDMKGPRYYMLAEIRQLKQQNPEARNASNLQLERTLKAELPL